MSDTDLDKTDQKIFDDVDPEFSEFSEESLLEAHQKSEELNADGTVEASGNLNFEITEESFEEAQESFVQESFVEGSELEQYESAEVEEQEFVEHERVISIVESLLFATDRPQSITTLLQVFKGTQVKSKDIRKAIETLMVEYAGGARGVSIEEVSGGYQLRTKVDNMEFLKRMVKGRTFKLSGPALEVLAITAYKQPCVKYQVDEIRGVESGHILRGLMERGLVRFAGKSDLPGKPMLYETTKKFLEIFGLRNIKELPSLNEIDDLIPEGIGEVEEDKTTLDQITGTLAQEAGVTYSEGEEELEKITGQLMEISTSSDFFEEEKRRAKAKKDEERAQSIREALIMEEVVSTKDKNWLEKYEQELKLAEEQAQEARQVTEGLINEESGDFELPDTIESAFSEVSDVDIKDIKMEDVKK